MMRYRHPIALPRSRRTPAATTPEIRLPMTICIAALYHHQYGTRVPEDVGMGIVTVSDRMWTMEELGIEYEPALGKYSKLTPHIMALVSDNISVHSDLLRATQRYIAEKDGPVFVDEIAQKYGEFLQQMRASRASQYALSLYGLSVDAFIEKQKHMDPNFLASFDSAMQRYEVSIKAQAIIVGFDPDFSAHIYYVDNDGIGHCYDDIGFCCIGAGHTHAVSQFALRGYANTFGFYPALLTAYVAKKAAEVAPGVGTQTDIHQIIKLGTFPMLQETSQLLEKTYKSYDKRRKNMERKTLDIFTKTNTRIIEEAIKANEALTAISSPSIGGQSEPMVQHLRGPLETRPDETSSQTPVPSPLPQSQEPSE